MRKLELLFTLDSLPLVVVDTCEECRNASVEYSFPFAYPEFLPTQTCNRYLTGLEIIHKCGPLPWLRRWSRRIGKTRVRQDVDEKLKNSVAQTNCFLSEAGSHQRQIRKFVRIRLPVHWLLVLLSTIVGQSLYAEIVVISFGSEIRQVTLRDPMLETGMPFPMHRHCFRWGRYPPRSAD